MIALLEKPWVRLLFGALLVAALTFVYTTCGRQKSSLSQTQVQAAETSVITNQAQVGADTTAAHRATASATTNYETGQAYAGWAHILHQQSTAHATHSPVVASDSAALRLQRFLSNY